MYGKIKSRMNAEPLSSQVTPPRLFATLIKGFNTTAARVHLILIPVLVDLALWLGPKLRLKALLQPLVDEMSGNLLNFAPAEMQTLVTSSQGIWQLWLEQFNFFSLIRTFPVGVPSLVARYSPIDSPLEVNPILEVPSLRVGLGVLGGLILVGYLLGTLYFNTIARNTLDEKQNFQAGQFFRQYAQSLLMFVVLIALAVMISLPIMLIISILSLLSPGLGQFLILFLGFMAFWLVFPLMFSPHGIFAIDQKTFPAMLLSVRMVRFFLPGAGLFFLVSALISEGLNTLWTLPDANSWLTLAGIGGHSFVITGLLAASFIYYREGLRWMQYNIQRMAELQKKQAESGGTSLDQQ